MGFVVPVYQDDCAPLVREMNSEFARRFCPAGGRVLDLGAGQGALSRALRSAGFQTSAVDRNSLTDPNFEGVTTVEADINRGVPFPDGSFDLVISEDVVHQLENPWFIFREVARVLAPRGHFVLSTPNMHHLFVALYELLFKRSPHFLERHYRLAHQISPLPLWNVNRMAEEANFENVVTTYNMNYLPLLRLRLPFRTPRLGHTLMLVYQKA